MTEKGYLPKTRSCRRSGGLGKKSARVREGREQGGGLPKRDIKKPAAIGMEVQSNEPNNCCGHTKKEKVPGPVFPGV